MTYGVTTLSDLQEIAKFFLIRISRDGRGFRLSYGGYCYFSPSIRSTELMMYRLGAVGNY